MLKRYSPRAAEGEKMERETGLEPGTNCLGSNHSTTELLPLKPRGVLYPHCGTDSIFSLIKIALGSMKSRFSCQASCPAA